MERVVKFLKDAGVYYLATISAFTHEQEVIRF